MKKNLFNLTMILFFLFSSCKKENIIRNDQSEVSKLTDGLITLNSGIVVEKRGSEYIWQGDISLSPAQFKALNEKGTLFSEVPKSIGPDTSIHPVFNIPTERVSGNIVIPRAISIYPTVYNLWSMVRFTYDSSLSLGMKASIRDALITIESQTNVRFYNATGEPTSHPVFGVYPCIKFIRVAGDVSVSSGLGRQGGIQTISFADFILWNPENIIHEIGHALGMMHEHNRLDRNSYVIINTSNLKPYGLAQFQIPTTNYYQTGTYDFSSIMGYASETESASLVNDTSLPMYTKLDGSYIDPVYSFSNSDREWVNYFHIPFIARSDTYYELADIVFKPDNTIMTPAERLTFQASLNYGDPNPPNCCRLTNDLGRFN